MDDKKNLNYNADGQDAAFDAHAQDTSSRGDSDTDNEGVRIFRSESFTDGQEETAEPRKRSVPDRARSSRSRSSGSSRSKKSGFSALIDGMGFGGGKNGKKSGKKDKKKSDDPAALTKKQRVWRTVWHIALTVFCVLVILGCALAVILSIYLVDVTADDDALLDLNSLKLSYSTILMAKNPDTQEWEEYERIYGNENRVWVDYEDMPQHLVEATISSEDQRFLSHHGVDLKRTIAAFVNEYVFQLYSNTQGGSTITQQLVKNITSENSVGGLSGVLRKVREIYRALRLEQEFSKEQILEAYLNTFRLSGQLAGIESAANYYFNKTTSELSVAECAAIVCITKYPTKYDPISNPDENKNQRETILWQMNQYGYLTDAEYQQALSESAGMTFTEGNTSDNTQIYSYFTDTAIEEVIGDLQKYNNLSYDEAYTMFYEQGLTVYLTVDPTVQAAVEDVAVNGDMWPALEYNDDGTVAENQLQGAMVVMNYQGESVGIAGGIREKTESLGLNRAYGSMTFYGDGTYAQTGGVRQTGSSMKPLAVYAPALELNKITYSSLFEDSPVMLDENGSPYPRNYGRTYGEYGTSVTVYEAVRVSLNTVAVKVLQTIGYDFAFDFVETRLGVTTLVDNSDNIFDTTTGKRIIDRTLSLGLGSLTFGASPHEMCAAYAVFGNGGTYITPHCYTKVVDARGNVILDTSKTNQTIKALSDDTAYIMNKLLQGVATQGTGLFFKPSGSLPYAGKSGTTSDAKDYWYIGMNPYYVMACWQGYDQPQTMVLPDRKPAGMAFKAVMGTISADLEWKDFPSASGVGTATICKASGDLASPECTETMTGYYKSGFYPTTTCVHALAPVKEIVDYSGFTG
ncbi:MAG: transglycosylase domain-containing protein [Oscillospiraceae bacterium]|nr:transglycosylase domain-containing protein [Oscillospiraceae bacterium]